MAQLENLRERYRQGLTDNLGTLPVLPFNDREPATRLSKGNRGVIQVNGTFQDGFYDQSGIPDDIQDRASDTTPGPESATV